MTTLPVCRSENTVGCGRLGVLMTEREQVLRIDGSFGFESRNEVLVVCGFGKEEKRNHDLESATRIIFDDLSHLL